MTEQSAPDSATDGFDLDPIETRVLGVLIEKAFVTPDAYPLSLNGIVTGCNQLTGREPVMSLSDGEVQAAVDSLMARSWCRGAIRQADGWPSTSTSCACAIRSPPPEQSVLAVLLLRGAQTAGEIRQRAERMHRFDDIAAVETVLEHLAEKYPPMADALPRAPGTKETRYAHLLGGTAAFEAMGESLAGAPAGGAARGRTTELEDEVRRLREELDRLRSEFDTFRTQFD